MHHPITFILCLISTGICALCNFMLLHIMMPPLIPQAATCISAGITILIGYPVLRARIIKIWEAIKQHHKRGDR